MVKVSVLILMKFNLFNRWQRTLPVSFRLTVTDNGYFDMQNEQVVDVAFKNNGTIVPIEMPTEPPNGKVKE